MKRVGRGKRGRNHKLVLGGMRHAKKRRGKNQIPLEILEKRAGKLVRLVHRRGGEPT